MKLSRQGQEAHDPAEASPRLGDRCAVMLIALARLTQKRAPRSVTRFADDTRRGIWRVMLQNNPVTGLLFLLGIFISSWVSGLYALLGTAVSTACAFLLGAPRSDIDHGLYGLSGTLSGVGLAFYLQHDAMLLICVVVACAFVPVVTAVIQDIFAAQGHALTGQSAIVTWLCLLARASLGRLQALSPQNATTPERSLAAARRVTSKGQ